MRFNFNIKKVFILNISLDSENNYYSLSYKDYSIYHHNIKIDNRIDLLNHSPLGLSWGYIGSGPSQSALAILSDFVNEEYAKLYYEKFRDDVIALLDSDKNHKLKYSTIKSWIKGNLHNI